MNLSRKWQGQKLNEKQGYQQHFLDLCDLVGHSKPADVDKTAASFCFERGAMKTGGNHGWADVWKRGFFAIEYKGPHGNLSKALQQVQRYALALENPPLLVVCDLDQIQIHTNFTNTVSEVHTIALEDVALPANIAKLKALFFDPERFLPSRTIDELTAAAAKRVAGIAAALHTAGHDPQTVAHFLNQCVFCCYAEDVGLLPHGLFTRLLETCKAKPSAVQNLMGALFKAMGAGGYFGPDEIAWFNGGLFADVSVINLPVPLIDALLDASRMDWGQINPSIFGTLFERGLDPAKRSQLGAHYTDAASILRILRPIIEEPLLAEWAIIKDAIAKHLALWQKGGKGSKLARDAADASYQGFLERLRLFRVLDPACGSGNFLYLSLRMLKDIQHRVMLEAETVGLHYDMASLVGPEAVMGIELSPYAAELARVTVWIGEIQWMLDHGFQPSRNPILKALDFVDCRDALLQPNGLEAEWPLCDVIVGNPPFLGGSKKRGELGSEYFDALENIFDGRVPGGADLVCYWFDKAKRMTDAGLCRRAGFVATNSIRGGANRKVLDTIAEKQSIFNAWSDEPWINEGAAVRVSLICFAITPPSIAITLNGSQVAGINRDLTAGGGQSVDVTQSRPLPDNFGTCFMGASKKGPLDVSGDVAREWIGFSGNPNGRPNSEVLKPLWNAFDLTRRPRDVWVIDFGTDMTEHNASLYEKPFQYVVEYVKPVRATNGDAVVRQNWWRIARSRPELRAALQGLDRFIGTPALSKHRIFTWLPTSGLPDQQVLAVARSDDATFGVLQSRFHELWALALGTSLEDRPRYTPTTTFETFPFPEGLSPTETAHKEFEEIEGGGRIPKGLSTMRRPYAEGIARDSITLVGLRDQWLNPSDWVVWKSEADARFPMRAIASPGHEAELKKRTLTNLYNQRPAWLANAHAALDRSVALAYGWDDYDAGVSDEQVLARLLSINLERATKAGVPADHSIAFQAVSSQEDGD